MPKKVLLVGLQSSSVDFSKWPALDRDRLEKAFVTVKTSLEEAGFVPRWCLVDDGATAAATLRKALEAFTPDIVSIGAGVRADPDHLRLFEDVVNLVHRLAPQAVFAFNTDPLDTIASVKRAAAS